MGYYMPSPFKDPKTGVFKLRIRVPKDIEHIIGKKLVIKTLSTKDLPTAKVRFVHEYQNVQRDFASARLQLTEDSSTKLTPADVQIIADRWVESALQHCERTGDFTRWLATHDDGDVSPLHLIDDSLTHAPYEKQRELVGAELDAFLREIGLSVSPHADAYRALIAAFTDRAFALSQLCKQRHHGDWSTVHQGIQGRSLSVAPATATTPRLSEVFDAYAKDKRHTAASGRVEKHIDEYRANLMQFLEVCGDLPVAEYRREHIAEFRSQLLQLPRSKAPELRSKPILQQIETATAQGLPHLSPATVKKRIRFLGSIFTEAIDRGWITHNPTHGATKKLATRRQSVTSARGYADAELPTIFASPLFTAGFRPALADFGEAPYWVPIIASYTGARLEEICQLYVADIAKHGDIWCFNFTDERPDQSIKTDAARLVPLHADLITLGLLDYLNDLPADGRAFPKLTADKYGKYSTRVGDWLRGYLRDRAGVRSDVQPLHGFRHIFKTLCRNAEIEEEWHDALTGHSGRSVGRDYGQHEIKKAKELIDRLPGVIKHLQRMPNGITPVPA